MSEQASVARRRRRPPRSRRPWARILVVLAFAALVFAVGVAFGRALQDRPSPGGEQTIVRTLEPLPQQTASP